MIEQHHPEVEFDWTAILKGPVEVGTQPRPEPEREARRSEVATRRQEPRTKRPDPHESPRDTGGGRAEAELGLPESGQELTSPPFTEPASAALTRLGAEALQRLRGRYAELLARISEKVTDPVRAEELKALAERLNPDTWVTDAEVSAGLEHYESVFSELRAVVGRRRKRRMRRPAQSPAAQAGTTSKDAGDPGPGEPARSGPDADEQDSGDPEL